MKFYSTHQNTNEGIDEFYNRFENAKDLVILFKANAVDIDALLVDEQLTQSAAKKETIYHSLTCSKAIHI